ncbi:MAG: DNA polymerase III subunit delta, partial [Clostridiales bacterium]|nr:DNA polymerase III subunit delta [Clostridiales bacterium]
PQQRIPYLEEELKRLGKTSPPSLLDRISRQSSDTAGCIRELEKLAAYAGMESVLTAPMADAVLTPGVEADIFRLVDALGQRKQTQALQELQALFGKGESPFYLFAMMLRQFRIIFRAKACLQDGLSDRQISQALGIHPYSAQKAVSQSRLFTYPVLEKVLARFLDADLAMKSSGAGEHSLILTDLVLALLTYY